MRKHKNILIVIGGLISIILISIFVYLTVGLSLNTDAVMTKNITLNNETLKISGTTSNSGQAFTGYKYIIKNDSLYLELRYSFVNPIYNNGDFNVSIDKNFTNIKYIYLQGNKAEDKKLVWTKSVSTNNTNAVLKRPDKIIVYDLGKSKEIKNSDKEFDKIVNLTRDRIDFKKISFVKDIVDDGFIGQKKDVVMAVEFIYGEEQELSVNGDSLSPIKYNKLFFELFDRLSSAMSGGPGHTIFQYGDLNHYKASSIGPLKGAEELITIVENVVD